MTMTLVRCYRFASFLRRFRAALWVLTVVAVSLFLATLFACEGSIDAAYALASLSLLLWALWFLAVSYCFVRPPPEVLASDRFWLRIRTRFQRATVWALVLAVVGLLTLALMLTSRTIGLLVGS